MTYQVIASGCVMSLAFICAQAAGQYPNRYSPPGGRTLPNALNYFRRDVGVLDQYNSFVQPTRQLQDQLNYMSHQEHSDYQRTQREIGQVRSSLAAPTGTNATYMNHGQYFNINRGQGRR